MPNFNTDKILAGAPAKAMFGVNTVTARVSLTGQAAADTVTLARLPAGAQLIKTEIVHSVAPFATSHVVQIGDGTGPGVARFGSTGGTAVTAAIAVAPGYGINNPDTAPLTAETAIVATIPTATGTAGAGVMVATLFYTMNP